MREGKIHPLQVHRDTLNYLSRPRQRILHSENSKWKSIGEMGRIHDTCLNSLAIYKPILRAIHYEAAPLVLLPRTLTLRIRFCGIRRIYHVFCP